MQLKLMTLNLHCFAEKDIPAKQRIIADAIFEHDLDIVFLQEVAQTPGQRNLYGNIKIDNYGYRLVELLKEKHVEYNYYYQPIKKSFAVYDEGLAILSKTPLELVECKYISRSKDYDNWKSRMNMFYRLSVNGKKINLINLHLGWSDGYEVFEDQFDAATKNIDMNDLTILGGDMNVPLFSQEYQGIIDKGWLNILSQITGYQEITTFFGNESDNQKAMNIDYFFANRPVKLIDKSIFFKKNPVSDHMGIYISVEI